MKFNLDSGAVRSKVIFSKLTKFIDNYSSNRGYRPKTITVFPKDFDTLMGKANKALYEADSKYTSPVELYYLGVRLEK